MKKILFLLAFLLMPSLVSAMSPAYNIVQYAPDRIIAGSNDSLNYSFQIRTTDTVPIYFQFNISGTGSNANTTGEFNLSGTFINRVYCEQNTTSSVFSCYDNNTEAYLGAGSYNLYMFLYTQPYAFPDNYTISMDIVSGIKQVDYQQITNTVYYNSGGGIITEYRNITNNTMNPPIIKEVPIYINNGTNKETAETGAHIENDIPLEHAGLSWAWAYPAFAGLAVFLAAWYLVYGRKHGKIMQGK